jgi:biopolymer transport protein ExbD
MKFRRHLGLEPGLSQIDIAPLIDMVFQLLIFFMLTSSFIFQPGIRVNLPKAVTSEVIQEESLVITISSENLIYINEKLVTTDELKMKLKAMSSDKKPLLIKADRRASLGKVVEVWDLCRELGISQINIATNQPPS